MTTSIAAIGLGGLGRVLLRSLADLETATVVAGVDVSPDARKRFEREYDASSYADVDALLAARNRGDVAVDAAVIATPHALHAEQATACLEAGLHVLVEKPMVTDVADAVDLVRTAEERDRVLQVGYQRHFHPAYAEIKRVIDEGRIGEVHAANASLGQDWIDLQRGTWRTDPGLSGGGQLYDSGSHLLDALLWTTGTRARRVSARMAYDDPGVDVNAALSIELERCGENALGGEGDGRTVIASVLVDGDGVGGEPHESYTVWGTAGRLAFDGERIRVTEGDGVTYETAITDGTDFATLATRKLENFVAAARGEAEPAVPGDTGLEITALTEAAYRAAEDGRAVDVRKTIEEARADAVRQRPAAD